MVRFTHYEFPQSLLTQVCWIQSAHKASHPLLKRAGWDGEEIMRWGDEVDAGTYIIIYNALLSIINFSTFQTSY